VELSIIIVNYNTEEELFQCILSITQSRINVEYEVIVVDNASKKGSLSRVKNTFNIRTIQNTKNVGFARAVNQGIHHSKGKYILLLNPDTVVEQNTIQTLLDWIKEKKDLGCVAPAITYPDGKLQPSVRSFPTFIKVFFGRRSLLTRLFPNNPITRSYLLLDMDYTKPQEVDWVTGACLMTRKDILNEVGLLDERFFLFVEDADFCYRLKEHGYKVYYIPNVKVIHKFGAATDKFWQRSLLSHNFGMFLFFEKHYNPNIVLKSLLFIGLTLRLSYIFIYHTVMDHFRNLGSFRNVGK
jgi:hypothetical protein